MNYWCSEIATKLVLVILRFYRSLATAEKIVGVKDFISKVFIEHAVRVIGAAACGNHNRSARTAAILGRIRIGHHLKFLDRVDRWPGGLRAEFLNVFRKSVVVDSIYYKMKSFCSE